MMSQKYPWVRQVFSMMTRPSFSRTIAGMTLIHSGQTEAVLRGRPRGAWNSFITRAGIFLPSLQVPPRRPRPEVSTHPSLHNPSVVPGATKPCPHDEETHGLLRYNSSPAGSGRDRRSGPVPCLKVPPASRELGPSHGDQEAHANEEDRGPTRPTTERATPGSVRGPRPEPRPRPLPSQRSLLGPEGSGGGLSTRGGGPVHRGCRTRACGHPRRGGGTTPDHARPPVRRGRFLDPSRRNVDPGHGPARVARRGAPPGDGVHGVRDLRLLDLGPAGPDRAAQGVRPRAPAGRLFGREGRLGPIRRERDDRLPVRPLGPRNLTG